MKYFVAYIGSNYQGSMGEAYAHRPEYQTTFNKVIDIHPLEFAKQRGVTLVSWQILDAEDQLVWSRLEGTPPSEPDKKPPIRSFV